MRKVGLGKGGLGYGSYVFENLAGRIFSDQSSPAAAVEPLSVLFYGTPFL